MAIKKCKKNKYFYPDQLLVCAVLHSPHPHRFLHIKNTIKKTTCTVLHLILHSHHICKWKTEYHGSPAQHVNGMILHLLVVIFSLVISF